MNQRIEGVQGVQGAKGEMSGVVAMWTQDGYRDDGTAAGAGLRGRSDGGDGEVLLEVRRGEGGAHG